MTFCLKLAFIQILWLTCLQHKVQSNKIVMKKLPEQDVYSSGDSVILTCTFTTCRISGEAFWAWQKRNGQVQWVNISSELCTDMLSEENSDCVHSIYHRVSIFALKLDKNVKCDAKFRCVILQAGSSLCGGGKEFQPLTCSRTDGKQVLPVLVGTAAGMMILVTMCGALCIYYHRMQRRYVEKARTRSRMEWKIPPGLEIPEDNPQNENIKEEETESEINCTKDNNPKSEGRGKHNKRIYEFWKTSVDSEEERENEKRKEDENPKSTANSGHICPRIEIWKDSDNIEKEGQTETESKGKEDENPISDDESKRPGPDRDSVITSDSQHNIFTMRSFPEFLLPKSRGL